jgi:hypothetical protein
MFSPNSIRPSISRVTKGRSRAPESYGDLAAQVAEQRHVSLGPFDGPNVQQLAQVRGVEAFAHMAGFRLAFGGFGRRSPSRSFVRNSPTSISSASVSNRECR